MTVQSAALLRDVTGAIVPNQEYDPVAGVFRHTPVALAISTLGKTVTTGATSAYSILPTTLAGNAPTRVRLAASVACYARIGHGGDATATASLKAVSGAVGTAGTGYVIGDTITLAGGTRTTATVLTVATVGGSGEVLTFTISTAGVYSVLPANDVAQASTSGVGTGAAFTMTWGVGPITVTNGGSGYASAPAVTSTGGAGSGQTYTAVLTGGVVTSITVTAAGTGFTSVPTIAIAAGVTAAAGDILVIPGESVVINAYGMSHIDAIQVSAAGVLQISAIED